VIEADMYPSITNQVKY